MAIAVSRGERVKRAWVSLFEFSARYAWNKISLGRYRPASVALPDRAILRRSREVGRTANAVTACRCRSFPTAPAPQSLSSPGVVSPCSSSTDPAGSPLLFGTGQRLSVSICR